MSLETKHFYDFEDFRLDLAEKVLLRDGKFIPVTPKVFETLQVLVENAGRLLEKDELMREIWQDRFVAESNLTYNIKMLRKALGDSAASPRFVETVPKRGYRFIARVTETAGEPKPVTAPPEPDSPPAKKTLAAGKSKNLYAPTAVALVLLVSAIAYGLWFGRGSRTAFADAPVLNAPFNSEKLSTDGNVGLAAVSPDGKNIVYAMTNNGRQSVWLRQMETTGSVQIIPPSEDFYYGLEISPDGNFLYFARRAKMSEQQADIYRVSLFGGVPVKIVTETQGWTSVSPDGAKISFVRCFYKEEESCSLWIADADGRNERKLASRQRPFRIGDNEFAPDGKSVAFAAGQSTNGANEFGLLAVDLESGAERELSAQKFFNIKNLEWLPGQTGLLVTASKIPDTTFRIWRVSAADEDIEPLTKDGENYSGLSLSRDASVLASTQEKQNFRLRLYETENAAAAPQILASALSAAFAPDGKIVFSSVMTGGSKIWSVKTDGGEQRQLTSDAAADDLMPTVSPDGVFVFFASNRTGATHVWRMNADGSNPAQITKTEGGFPLRVSPDGKHLYYISALQKTLRRVSTEGGAEETVLDKRNSRFAVSPDGSAVAYPEKRGDETILIPQSLAGSRLIKNFKLADGKSRLIQLAWSPDGKSLMYVSADAEYENNVVWRQFLSENSPQRTADLGDEQVSEQIGFAVSPDGKSFVVVQGGWKHDAVLLKGLK